MTASVCPSTQRSVLRARAPLALAAAFGACALAPMTAHAGGFEYGVPGARSLGRAGADVAGIDTPLALYYNPANLGRMDRVRATVDVNLGLYDVCMRRELVADDGYEPEEERDLAVADEDGRLFLPQVCNSGRPSIVPNIGVAIPIVDGLTLGAGVLVPVSAQIMQYGQTPGEMTGPDGSIIPTPTRYIITHQDLLQLFGTIGIGYAPIPEFRVGASFGWGFTHARFTNVAYDQIAQDAPSYLDAKDKFVPRVTISAATTPIPNLDIAAAFTYVGDIRARGTVDIGFLGQIIDGPPASLVAGQPWTFTLGFRFADKLESPVGTVGDRLATERWDIEMTLGIIGSSRITDFAVDLPDDATVGGIIELPDALNIAHNWKNQYTVRVGGDYNIIPGKFATRLGLSYESNGVQQGFQQIDFLPFRRVGLHLGATLRIADRFDLSLAYAHLFQETTNVNGARCMAGDRTGCLNRPLAENNPPTERLYAANAGIIESSVNLISLQLDYAF